MYPRDVSELWKIFLSHFRISWKTVGKNFQTIKKIFPISNSSIHLQGRGSFLIRNPRKIQKFLSGSAFFQKFENHCLRILQRRTRKACFLEHLKSGIVCNFNRLFDLIFRCYFPSNLEKYVLCISKAPKTLLKDQKNYPNRKYWRFLQIFVTNFSVNLF